MRISRPLLGVVAAITIALIAVASVPQLLGSQVQRSLDGLSAADPNWLWAAGLLFVGSLAGSAFGWRSALGLVGGRIGYTDAGARYGIGSLVNSLTPARLGDAVRLGFFSRALSSDERLWRTGGVFATIGAARAAVLAVLVVCGSVIGALPLWPVLNCLGLVGIAVAIAASTRNRTARSRVAHVLDAFRQLGREPGRGARVTGWIAFSTLCRLGGAAAIASSLGVHRPIAAALIIIPALDLAGLMPLTPGNIGVTSGAVAMALGAQGVGMTTALTVGIALHAVETAAGLSFGAASALYLTPISSSTRRWTVLAASAAVSLALVGAFSATVLANVL